MKILKEIKNSPFVYPKKKYYFGKLRHGTPYFWPMNFNKNIISLRKLKLTPQEELDKLSNDFQRKSKRFQNLPMCRRAKDWIFQLFGNYFWLQVGWPIKVIKNDLGWKDKFHTPRFEWSPSFMVFFFHWQFCIWWVGPKGNNDTYWEMVLWYLKYSKKDLVKAEKTWGWINAKTKLSTWDKQYIK
jgi:hypothetical protein